MSNAMINYCIEELKRILSENFDSKDFSVGAAFDSAVCLERIGTKWHVFEGARAARVREEEYSTIVEAAIDMFDRLGTEEESLRMKNAFFSSMFDKKIA